ncbi:MAG: UDP-N-acetylmuramoyl-L-alanine--D-glutamate ligase [Actinomycetes bacterium]
MTGIHTSGLRVCVTGLGLSGAAAARALLDRDARVLAVDGRDDERVRAVAHELMSRGAEVRLGDAETPVDADLVVTSPGWRPTQPLLVAAQAQGIEVIGEPTLAWRLRPWPDQPWLGVTGTNGKTTTVGMLASILAAAGHRTAAAGNVGTPLVEAALATPRYDVLAVEMSSFQLHWSPDLFFEVGALLNIAEDHVDWHGSFEDYKSAKLRMQQQSGVLVVNRDDPVLRDAGISGEVVRFGTRSSEPGDFTVRDGSLVGPDGTAILPVDDLPVRGPHNVSNALAAAAIARTFGVAAAAVHAGLSGYRAGAHRNAVVDDIDGVRYVNDSKATNPHAADASLSAYDTVVWVAGGLLKGAAVGDLVREHASRLRAVVLIGADRNRFRDALARHAPDVPVVDVDDTDTGAMTAVVRAASRLAAPGDTVLLAPAAASMDMFRDYAERGDAFAAAVRRLAEERA